MQRIIYLFLLVMLVAACASTGGDIHVVQGGDWALSPTAPDGMKQRVEAAAIEYQQYAPVSRVAFFDIAYPASGAELGDMAGYGILLLTTLSQDPDELPPKRLYVVADGGEFPLTLITAARSSTQSNLASQVLGQNRWDALYLFPVYFTRDGASLAMDFAAHRDEFVLGQFSSADQERLGYGQFVDSAPTASPPSDAVTRLVSREFPGFLERGRSMDRK